MTTRTRRPSSGGTAESSVIVFPRSVPSRAAAMVPIVQASQASRARPPSTSRPPPLCYNPIIMRHYRLPLALLLAVCLSAPLLAEPRLVEDLFPGAGSDPASTWLGEAAAV